MFFLKFPKADYTSLIGINNHKNLNIEYPYDVNAIYTYKSSKKCKNLHK